MAAAVNLLTGNTAPFDPVPYFWSEQYDVSIQAHGLFPSEATVVCVDGDPGGDRFVVESHHAGRVVGVLGWNMPRQTHKRARLVLAEQSVLGTGVR
ncbi:oxidoreductase C-terminal domain-containing protein [Spirillospora sp. CA-255316]